jgi:hypothetical protein
MNASDRLSAAIKAFREPHKFDPPPPPPVTPWVASPVGEDTVEAVSMLPMPPNGKEWRFMSVETMTDHRDYFVRNLLVASSLWKLHTIEEGQG